MAEKLKVYEIRDELWDVAEKEAKKRPEISKEELKQKLTEHLLSSGMLKKLLPEGTAAAIEKIIGAVTEITVKTLEIYLRETGKGGEKEVAGKKRGRKRGRKKKVDKVEAAPKKKVRRRRRKNAKKSATKPAEPAA